MFYTNYVLEKNNPMSLPKFIEEGAKNDLKLFEGLIELDFAEVYSENGTIYLSEEDTQAAQASGISGIKAAIKKTIEDFKKAVNDWCERYYEECRNFVTKTTSVLTNDIINDPKFKQCTVTDIVYSDYWNECKKVINEEKCLEFLKKNNRDDSKEGLEAMNRATTRIAKIPITVDEYDNKKENITNTAVRPKSIGANIDPKKLQETLSATWILDYIEQLDKDFTRFANEANSYRPSQPSQTKYSEGNKEAFEQEANNMIKRSTQIRLKYLGTSIKMCTNTLKIAFRNASEIKAFIKGSEKAAEEKKNGTPEAKKESATLAYSPEFVGVHADLVFENIFEI